MKYISSAIIMIIVSLLMRYLVLSSKQQAVINSEGIMILKMNKAYGIIGYFGIVISAIIGILGSFAAVKSLEDFFVVFGIVLLFLLLGVTLVLVSRNMKIEVDNDKVKYYGFTSRTKEIVWDEIIETKFNRSSLELSLISTYSKVKIHMHMIGFPSLIEFMKQKVDYMTYKDALEALESVDKRFS